MTDWIRAACACLARVLRKRLIARLLRPIEADEHESDRDPLTW